MTEIQQTMIVSHLQHNNNSRIIVIIQMVKYYCLNQIVFRIKEIHLVKTLTQIQPIWEYQTQ